MRNLVPGLLLLAAACAPRPEAALPPVADAAIAVTVPAQGDWTVAYELPAPAVELVFARTPDGSRGEDWKAPEGFEIVLVDETERARRADGAAFDSVTFSVPPRYRELPKDYAPFMPFGDGGQVFYTGRLFACGGACPDDASWAISVNDAQERSVVVNGGRHTARAEWTDSGQGRNVYIGAAEPVISSDVVALIDAALPFRIRSQLEKQLPRFMAYFSGKLGALDYRPMLFASYDVSPHDGRVGRQGGTLPGQVFTHFYGHAWPEMINDPALPGDLAWFFAHEAGHLYQHEAWVEGGVNAWIHEGAAEAFAALALRADGAGDVADAKIAGARASCATATAQVSVHDAIAAGTFDAAYSCGLLVSLAIDEAAKRAAPEGDGLFAVWRGFMPSAPVGQHTEEGFLAAVAQAAGPALADDVRAIVRTPAADFGKLAAAPG